MTLKLIFAYNCQGCKTIFLFDISFDNQKFKNIMFSLFLFIKQQQLQCGHFLGTAVDYCFLRTAAPSLSYTPYFEIHCCHYTGCVFGVGNQISE